MTEIILPVLAMVCDFSITFPGTSHFDSLLIQLPEIV